MAHTYDTKLRFTGAASPLNSDYTCAAGVTVLVVSVVTAGSTNRAGGNPTFNSVTLSQADILRKYATSPETSCELFYLLDPPTGSAYQISVPNTGTKTLYVVASSYKAQSGYASALDQQNGNTGNTANPSVSVTTTVNGAVIVGVMGNGLTSVPTGRSGTILYETDNGQHIDAAQYYLQAAAGAWATSWTIAADDWCVCVAAFKEVAIQYTVQLSSEADVGESSNLGTITFGGTEYALPDSINKNAGDYSALFNPAAITVWQRWEVTGGVTLACLNANPTTATVSGDGTLKAIYILNPFLTLRPNAEGTYHMWNEVPNSGFLWAAQWEENDNTPWTGQLISGGTQTIQSTWKHHATYAAKFDVTLAGQYYVRYKTLASAQSPLYLRSVVRFTATPQVGCTLEVFPEIEDNPITKGLVNVNVINPAGTLLWRIYYYNDAGQQSADASASYTPAINTNYYVEILWKKSTAPGANNGEVAMWLNGTQIIDVLNVDNDTLSAQNVAVGVYISVNLTVSVYHDCTVASSTGPIGVENRPVLVNDQSDNTAVQAAAYTGQTVAITNFKSVYNLTDHTTETGTINSVTAYARAKYGAGGGDEKFKIILKLGATEGLGAEKTSTNAFAEYSDVWNTDPNAAAWTWANVDAVMVGAVPTVLGNAENIQVSDKWIVVDYTVAGVLRRLLIGVGL